jgi:murein DD-endopeptidase MepM/ murein hydrolase activator NlpD
MRRRPYRQAVPFGEIRERQQRHASTLRLERWVLLGGAAICAGALMVLVLSGLAGNPHAPAPASTFNAQVAAAPVSTPAGSVTEREASSPAAPSQDAPPGSEAPSPTGAPVASPTPLPSGPVTTPGTGDDRPAPVAAPTSAEPEALTGYQWPLRGGRISYFFAPRSDGFLVVDGGRIHEGLDITTYCGDRILAAHSGTVLAAGRHFDTFMGFDGSLAQFYGRLKQRNTLWTLPIVVVIDDGNGYRSAYVHLESTTVKPGQSVHVGDVIGYEGATGNATGCHLHFEMFRMDGPWMKVAPQLVNEDHYPPYERERIDPFRVLSMKQRGAPHFIPGINPPAVSPGLGRPTVTLKDARHHG